jgi:NAD(P)-dependent dehydrogenase (short-subunit alcohol dehydrogenase family)
VSPDHADQAAEAIQAAGRQAAPWTADVSNRFQVTAMIEAVREQWGALHIVVNATSVIKPAPLLSLDEYDWRRMIEIDLTGSFFCTQLAARVMIAEGGGAIINVTRLPAGESAAYASAQSGLMSFTRAAALELAAQSVRMNGVTCHPAVEPAAVAPVVLFLCSQGASALVGQTLMVDGRQ